MKKIQSLTISIPAYNDSRSLIKLVDEAQSLCSQLSIPFEMLIINDGSFDNTLAVAENLAKKYNNVKIVSHEKNLGFGETLKKVFMIPQTEWVLFLPGDNQFPASNLIKYLEVKDNFDYILGYRKNRKDPVNRKLYSSLYNWLVSTLSGFKVHDVNSIVFYRSSVFEKFILTGTSAFVHAEFFIRTKTAGFRVTEIEVLHQEREFGFGSGGNIPVAFHAIRELFMYFVRKRSK